MSNQLPPHRYARFITGAAVGGSLVMILGYSAALAALSVGNQDWARFWNGVGDAGLLPAGLGIIMKGYEELKAFWPKATWATGRQSRGSAEKAEDAEEAQVDGHDGLGVADGGQIGP